MLFSFCLIVGHFVVEVVAVVVVAAEVAEASPFPATQNPPSQPARVARCWIGFSSQI
jgi:hypothetical protein